LNFAKISILVWSTTDFGSSGASFMADGVVHGVVPRARCKMPVSLTPLLALLLPLAVLLWWPAQAKEPVWDVAGKLVGKHGKKSENVSGIACITSTTGFPRSCLVIDDNLQAAQFVTVDDGELEAGDTLPLIDNRYDEDALELDGEGVAYAGGWFYVIGSHGHPRDSKSKLHPVRDRDQIKARIAASSQIVRIRVRPHAGRQLTPADVTDIQRSAKLKEIIAANDVLKRFVDRRLENNGLTIEGVAIVGTRLFVGFRGPTLSYDTAPVLSVSVPAIFESVPPDPILHILPLGRGQGVRDLAAFGDGILILAGPTGRAAGPYDVYWWDGWSDALRHLADITRDAEADEDRKPEAILPLDEDASGLRLLVLSDGAKEGGPRPVVVPSP
jgi:hypothetical protein